MVSSPASPLSYCPGYTKESYSRAANKAAITGKAKAAVRTSAEKLELELEQAKAQLVSKGDLVFSVFLNLPFLWRWNYLVFVLTCYVC